MHSTPGDPFQDEYEISNEILDTIRAAQGLDKPIFEQFTCYAKKILHGDLGTSLRYPSEAVSEIIMSGVFISFQLGVQAFCIALFFGSLLGITSAYFSNRLLNTITTLSTSLTLSIPPFMRAALFQFVFAIFFSFLPIANWGTFQHSILPSFALSLGPLCVISQLVKSNILDTLSKDWIVVARMKGLTEKKILLCHIFPTAVLPLLHYIGPTITNLLVGSFAVERIFCIPGMGQWFIASIISRDYPVVFGLSLFYSLILFTMYTCVDIITYIFYPTSIAKRRLV